MKTLVEEELFDFNINPPSKGYDLQNSLAFAILSHLAYKDEGSIYSATTQLGFEDSICQCFNGSRYDTEFFTAASEKHIVVAFRGTEVSEKCDVATDAKVDMKTFAWDGGQFDGKIHHGFYDAVMPALPVLRDQVAELVDRYQAEHIWIAGHSLGAALGILASAFLCSQNINIAGIYVYGSPRVGDDAFGRCYRTSGLWDKTFRIVNCNDLVTMIPPPRPYHHVGIPVRININGEFQVGEKFWAHFKEITQQKLKEGISDLLNSRSIFSVSDHSMVSDHSLLKADSSGYIQQLQKALNEQSGIS